MADAPIVAYDPRWAEEFARIGATLREHLGDAARRIDHIGNTAVPGLTAKDILDVQLTLESLELGEDAERAFTELRLLIDPSAREDARLVGAHSEGDRVRMRRVALEHPDERQIHLHIREAGSPNERMHVLFREFLRTDESARASYGAVMDAIGALSRDGIDVYRAVKDPTSDLVLKAASLWAELTDWKLPPSDW